MRAFARELRGIDAVGLPRPHADARMVLRDQDGVRFHTLDDLPREQQVVHLLGGRHAFRRHGEGIGGFGHDVGILNEHAAVDGAEFHLLPERIHAAGRKHAQVLLLLEQLERRRFVIGRDQHLDEELMGVDGFDHGERDRLVGRDDTAVRALGIARERTLEGFGDSGAVGRSAGILMLEDHDGRIVEFAHDGPAGVRVEDVVIAERLAVELPRIDQRVRRRRHAAVEGRGLMGILAVAQVLLLDQVDRQALGKFPDTFDLARKPAGDGAVVGVRRLEHVQRETGARLARGGAAVRAHLVEDGAVAFGVDDHGDALEVLRGGAQHARTADIDVLDADGGIGAGGDGLLERIQVHDDHVDHADAMLRCLGHVRGVGALGQKTAVHLRMQGFHAAVHHLGKTRHVVDRTHGHAALLEDARGAARRYDFSPELVMQRAGEVHDAGLVRHRDENPLHARIVHTVTFPDSVHAAHAPARRTAAYTVRPRARPRWR